MNIEDITLREITHRQRDKCNMVSLMVQPKNNSDSQKQSLIVGWK